MSLAESYTPWDNPTEEAADAAAAIDLEEAFCGHRLRTLWCQRLGAPTRTELRERAQRDRIARYSRGRRLRWIDVGTNGRRHRRVGILPHA